MNRIHSQYANESRAAALFGAEKYRLMGLLARRFDDVGVIETAERKNAAYNEIAVLCATSDSTILLSDEHAELMRAAFHAHINELNRAMQTSYNQGAMERARMIEHSLSSVYGAQRSLAHDGAIVAQGVAVETGEE